MPSRTCGRREGAARPTHVPREVRRFRRERSGRVGVMNELLTPALPGRRITIDGMNCYVGGEGPPLLLVHGVGAASSAAEMRTVYLGYLSTRTVYAVDLPGFGFSTRTARDHTPRSMTDAVHAAAACIRTLAGPTPLDVVAFSTGCEFVARAAFEAPGRYGRLAFISPTGLEGGMPRRAPFGRTREVRGVHALLAARPWGEPLFRALTHPVLLRHTLERAYGSRAVDETLLTYSAATVLAAGAHHAPLQAWAGRLASADIHRIYEGLTQAVWASHGDRGAFADFGALDTLAPLQRWHRTVFATGALPHLEAPREFASRLDAFLSQRSLQGASTAARPRLSWGQLAAAGAD